MEEDFNLIEEETSGFSVEEKLFLSQLNLPEDIFFYHAFEGKILFINKMGTNLLFINEFSESYIVGVDLEEKALSDKIWFSNTEIDAEQLIIVGSPLEALYYERIYHYDNAIYLCLQNTTNEDLNQLKSFISKNFVEENIKIKICLQNTITSFYKELKIIEALTGEKFRFDSEQNVLCYTSQEIEKREQVKGFFLKIKEAINLNLIKNNFSLNEIVLLNTEDNKINLTFPNFDLFKKESRKIILSLSNSINFLDTIEISRPPKTNVKNLFNWKIIHDIKFPREEKKKK